VCVGGFFLSVNAKKVQSLTHFPMPFSSFSTSTGVHRFFGPIFRLLSTVMPASVRDQFQICSSPGDVEKFISPDVLPVEYGGKNSLQFGQSEEEVSLRALVDRNNAEGGDRQMDKLSY
jgi:hypothetical protein